MARQVQDAGWLRRRYGYYWTKLVGAAVVLGGWTQGFVRLGTLRCTQPLVATHCVAAGVPYTRTNLWQSYRLVVRYLNKVWLKVGDPFLCLLIDTLRAR